MRQDQQEGLAAQRARLAEVVQRQLDTPEDQRPTNPKELRAWLKELQDNTQALTQLDAILGSAERSAARRTKQADQTAQPVRLATIAEDAIVLAKIPQSINYELRVTLQTWKGRLTVDLRTYCRKTTGEIIPTKRGLQIDVRRLAALLEALRVALQHV